MSNNTDNALKQHPQLRREMGLGLGNAVTMGLGSMIGTGVSASIGIASETTGVLVSRAIPFAACIAIADWVHGIQFGRSRCASAE